MSSSTSKQPVLLQSVLSMIIVATSVGSAWYCQGNLYGGRTAAHVWWYGWVTALSTGVGALPMIFCKDRMSEWWLGLANAMAGGMMTAASAALIEEGLEVSVGPRSSYTPLQCVSFGGAVGVAFIWLSQQALSGTDDVKLSILEGIDAKRGLLIVLVMTLHSFSEGIGIGKPEYDPRKSHGAPPPPAPSPPLHRLHIAHCTEASPPRALACRPATPSHLVSGCSQE